MAAPGELIARGRFFVCGRRGAGCRRLQAVRSPRRRVTRMRGVASLGEGASKPPHRAFRRRHPAPRRPPGLRTRLSTRWGRADFVEPPLFGPALNWALRLGRFALGADRLVFVGTFRPIGGASGYSSANGSRVGGAFAARSSAGFSFTGRAGIPTCTQWGWVSRVRIAPAPTMESSATFMPARMVAW